MQTHVMNLYSDMNILPVPLMHELQLLVFIHKYFHHVNTLPEVFHSYLVETNDVHNYNTRTKRNLYMSCINSRFGQKCIRSRGGKLWNSLPENLKQYYSVEVFKRKVKTFLRNRTD